MDRLNRFFLRLFLLLIFPQIIFSSGFLTPVIRNHGEYKNYDPINLKQLHGHVPAIVNNSTKLGLINEDHLLSLSIVLELNHKEELHQLLLDLSNPGSIFYQNYLSQEEFIDRYAPEITQVNNVKNYLISHNIAIESVDANRLIIHALGSVSSINKAFNTEIYNYLSSAGREYFAPAYELQVENNLTILSVLGLENIIEAKPQYKASRIKDKLELTGALSPTGIRTAYSLSTTHNGQGQILGLFELDGFSQTDINTYTNTFGLPQIPMQTVLVSGATGVPGAAADEVVLDIDLMIALAPQATKIIVYEGPNSGSGIINTYNKIAVDNLAKSVSTSWGIAENAGIVSLFQAENQIFMQMAAQGQSMYAASGDNDAYANGSTLSVIDPASQPFVVGVGGTTLSTLANGTYAGETTWSSGTGPGHLGSGGGISIIWPIPSWQQGVITSASGGSTIMRNIPDVSLDADPQTGYLIYFNGAWYLFGGTSASAPLWAAFNASVNQQRVSLGLGLLGFPNPSLYQLGRGPSYNLGFHDIKDNSINGFYPAVTGYDLATGWGTFIGDQLLTLLSGNTSLCTRANPTVTITPSSASGTAGQTLNYTVSVHNNDSASCTSSNFNLASLMPSGFTGVLGQTVLSLAPGQTGSTNIAVTSSASSAAGSYFFSVRATNASFPSFVSLGSATYVLTVPCTHANPSVSISPSLESGSAGQALTYTVLVSNQDNASCPTSNFNLSALVPAGFSFSFAQSVLSIAPGHTASTTITVTSSISSAPGSYTFSVKATNASVPTFTSSASAFYTVSSCHRNPTVTITPSQEQGFPGQTLTYVVFVQNNDSTGCSSSTFNLMSSLPTGFSAALAQSSLSIAPGQTAWTTITVTSSASSAVGNYVFSIRATNVSAPTFIGTGPATYSVIKQCTVVVN